MKLILQIAAGVILAWLAIRALEITTARIMIDHAMSTARLPPLPAVTSGRTTAELDAAIARDFAQAQREHDARFKVQNRQAAWTITTTDGETYTGTGTPPPWALNRTTKPEPPPTEH